MNNSDRINRVRLRKRIILIIVITPMIISAIILAIGVRLLDSAADTLDRERAALSAERDELNSQRVELQRQVEAFVKVNATEINQAELSTWAARSNALADADFAKALKGGQIHP